MKYVHTWIQGRIVSLPPTMCCIWTLDSVLFRCPLATGKHVFPALTFVGVWLYVECCAKLVVYRSLSSPGLGCHCEQRYHGITNALKLWELKTMGTAGRQTRESRTKNSKTNSMSRHVAELLLTKMPETAATCCSI